MCGNTWMKRPNVKRKCRNLQTSKGNVETSKRRNVKTKRHCSIVTGCSWRNPADLAMKRAISNAGYVTSRTPLCTSSLLVFLPHCMPCLQAVHPVTMVQYRFLRTFLRVLRDEKKGLNQEGHEGREDRRKTQPRSRKAEIRTRRSDVTEFVRVAGVLVAGARRRRSGWDGAVRCIA